MADLVGKTIGQYRIVRELGHGGMAIVYEAYQPSLNRAVAIKVLPQQFTFDKTFVQRFLQEARAAAKLEHPNIVAIHDVGEQDGVFYFVMQKVTGEPLNALIARAGHLSPARAARIVAQVGAALDYAHRHGIVHRDIKPGNIIIGADDHATLTDFGIAKAAEGTQITQSGVVIGTPEYMSPEQATGKPVEPASDIYSLGIVLYQMLSGQVPFQADSTPALLYKQVYELPAPLRGRLPGLPPAVDEVLGKALAKDSAARFRSAGEFADATQRAVEGLPVAFPASAAPTVNAPVAPRSRRPPWAAIAGGAAGVVLVGALALKLLVGGNPAQPTWKPPDLPTVTVTQGLSAMKPAATFTPSPLNTKPEPTRGKPQVQARSDVKVYAGPAVNSAAAGQVAAGQRLDVIAKDPSGQWYRVCCVGAEPVWVEAALVDTTGPIDAPVVTAVSPSKTPPPTAMPSPTLTAKPAPSSTPTPAVGRVVFASDRSGFAHIFAIDGNGRGLVALTSGNEYYWNPVLSDDGSQLAFVSKVNGNTEIFVAPSAGSNRRVISNHPAEDDHPAWFPNNQELAFASQRDGNWGVYRMRADGSNVRRLTTSTGDNRFVTVSPDGRQIAYVALGNNYPRIELRVINADGSNDRAVLSYLSHKQRDDIGRFVYRADWSSDGLWIAFGADEDDDGIVSVLLVDPNTGKVQRIIADGNGPVWSPDSQRLIYKPAGTRQILFVADKNGKQVYRLTGAEYNAWSPDWAR